MKITKLSLVTAIEDVLPIVKDTFVRSMSVICFDEDVIRSNNGSVGIISKLETGLKCCVPGRKFYEILRSLNSNDIDLEYDGNEGFVVSANSFSANLKASTNDGYPLRVQPTKELIPMPKDLHEGMELVRFSVSEDAMRPYLCGINIKKNQIISADGYRTTRVLIDSDVGREVLIHPGVVDIMLQRKDILKYCLSDNWIHLSNFDERVIVSSSLFGYTYPSMEEAFVMGENCTVVKFPKDLIGVVRRACIATEGIFLLDRMVTLDCDGKKIVVISEGSRFGKVIESMDLEEEAVPFKVDVNPVFFEESLKLDASVVWDPDNRYLRFNTDKLSHVVVGETDEENT